MKKFLKSSSIAASDAIALPTRGIKGDNLPTVSGGFHDLAYAVSLVDNLGATDCTLEVVPIDQPLDEVFTIVIPAGQSKARCWFGKIKNTSINYDTSDIQYWYGSGK